MMNILVYNRKGGVGKTTVADELMFSLERDGISCAYIDLDDQESSVHADETERADKAEVLVIDTPGALTSEVQAWMSDADIIVIPTTASGRDIGMLQAALRAADEYAPHVPRIIVLNRYNRYRAAQEFHEALKEETKAEQTYLVTLPQSEAIQNAYLNDRSVVEEAPKSTAAYHTLLMVNQIRSAAGLPQDPIDPVPIRLYIERQTEMARKRREAMKQDKQNK